MALLKKEKICAVEEFTDKGDDNKKKKAFYRVGELLTFRDDTSGDVYQRIKLSLFANQVFHVFQENGRG